MGRFVRLGLVLAATAGLSGCSSLGVGTGGGTVAPATGPQVAGLLGTDAASAVVVLDLPGSLEPVPGESTVAFRLAAPGGEARTVEAVLVPADAEGVMETLPPPATDRTYYLFGFSSKDQQKLREAQDWARVTSGVDVQVELLPALCKTEAIDEAKTRVSILAVVSGGRLTPLRSNAPVVEMAAARNRPLAACAGHSG